MTKSSVLKKGNLVANFNYLIHKYIKNAKTLKVTIPTFFLKFLAILIAISFVTFEMPSRSLKSPLNIEKYYSGKSAIIPIHAEIEFKTFVPKDSTSDRFSLMIGTYQRTNECKLTLELHGLGVSREVSCSDLKDNDVVTFYFENAIPPGLYDGKIRRAGPPSQVVALYIDAGHFQNQFWVVPYDNTRSLFFYSILMRNSVTHPYFTLFHIICILLAVGALLFRDARSIMISMIALYLGIISVSKPYSGFDETAHIDMMHRQFRAQTDEARPEFWKRVYDDMLLSKFPQLNRGIRPVEGSCPHQILGTCGYTKGPERLYAFYYHVLKLFTPQYLQSRLDFDSPLILRNIGILFSVAWILLLFILVAVVGGGSYLLILSATLILYGGYLSQFPTITNDIPLATYGVFLSVAATAPFTRTNRKLDFFGFFVAIALCFLLFSIDRSILTALPIIAVLPLCWYSSDLLKKNSSLYVLSIGEKLFLALFIAGSLISISLFIRWIILHDPTGFLSFFYDKFPDARIVRGIGEFKGFRIALGFLWQYVRSFFGSYIWGHSYYHFVTYLGLTSLFAHLSFKGVMYIRERGKGSAWPILLLFCLLASTQFIIVLAVSISAGDFPATDIIRDSFLKTRLTAPGTGAIMALSMLGLHRVCSQHMIDQRQPWSMSILKIWVLALLCYYLPKMYIVDSLW